ncbi:MAG: DNA-directed RNA polymerase subunit beta, partial [Actinomycetia bacterium]|nr:DNA-directed RNA polymerase subunit beta [Actinomycetes bacterium]
METPPVRSAEDHGARTVQAVRDEAPRGHRRGPEHQGSQAHGRAQALPGVERAGRRHRRAPGASQPCADASPPR